MKLKGNMCLHPPAWNARILASAPDDFKHPNGRELDEKLNILSYSVKVLLILKQSMHLLLCVLLLDNACLSAKMVVNNDLRLIMI